MPVFALPSAILLLRQGFGRLIRGNNDFGVAAILDTRLVSSSYGKAIVSSLPDMDIVHHVQDVERFFNSIPIIDNSVEKRYSVSLKHKRDTSYFNLEETYPLE